MTLSANRQHKIIATTMGQGLGSEDPEEVSYYKQIKEEMKQDRLIGSLEDQERINLKHSFLDLRDNTNSKKARLTQVSVKASFTQN